MATPTPPTSPSLDHLILFLPLHPPTSLPSVPLFFTRNFTLTPGGVHADNITSNTLILLSDGCYIELISFLRPAAAPTHWWGPEPTVTGWRDWCLTTPDGDAQANWKRVGDAYALPVRGGRKRNDGVHVQWEVTFPAGEMGGQATRGKVPFFCHDVTEREVRVPTKEEKSTHKCGVVGVLGLTVVVKDRAALEEMRGVYGDVLGVEGREGEEGVVFEVGRVREVEGLGRKVRVVLRVARGEEEQKKVEGRDFVFGDVVLGAKAMEGKMKGTKERIDGEGEEMSVGGLWIEYV